MKSKLFYLQNAFCNPDNGYLVAYSESRFEWGKIENAMKMTRKQINEFKKIYSGKDPIFSVECD